MTALFFISTYGLPLAMIAFAWAMEPKKQTQTQELDYK